jgi:hypothetical protein
MKLRTFTSLLFVVGCAGGTFVNDVPDSSPVEVTSGGPKRVFATSVTYTGALGGTTGADSICTAAATKAGLGGKWVAWISTYTANAIDRLPSDASWYLVDGTTIVFQSKAAIPALPEHAIDQDENGAPVPTTAIIPGDPVGAWTGTSLVGIADSELCMGWTSESNGALGDYGSTKDGETSVWTALGFAACSKHMHLYCFEQ